MRSRIFHCSLYRELIAGLLFFGVGSIVLGAPIHYVAETTSVLEAVNDGDADDPAIYVHPTDPGKSIVFGTRKKNGIGAYDLAGNQVFEIAPPDDETLRFNNVAVEYGFSLAGQKVDIAVVSDRISNSIRIFKINPNDHANLLEEITSPAQPLSFPEFLEEGEDTAYGLALHHDQINGKFYAFVSQNDNDEVPATLGNLVRQFELVDDGGTIKSVPVRTITLPTVDPDGVELRTIPDPTDPGDLLDRKAEGMVVDNKTGDLYIGQERVGIWKISSDPAAGDVVLDYLTDLLVDHAQVHDGKGTLGMGNLVNDIEGLSILYGAGDEGYLIASSQGSNEFAIYNRTGSNDFLGKITVTDPTAAGDDVDHSDGTDILAYNFGGAFPLGLLVVHDGENLPEDPDGDNTNFKYVSLVDLAAGFPGLRFDPAAYDPRNPLGLSTVPEPSSCLLILLGSAMFVSRKKRK